MNAASAPLVAALCGGVGGAKLALGLQSAAQGAELAVIVNTGDDFEHLGLTICPDLDTVMYTLAGVSDAQRGWGRAGESWAFMDALRALGGDDWFRLGDRDLATHVLRTEALRAGHTLSEVTRDLAAALAVRARIMPMTDHPVRTVITSDDGDLSFQRYFVKLAAAPRVRRIRFSDADAASAPDGVLEVLESARLAAVVLCPSNPFLSIDPILGIAGIRERLARTSAPVIAVSPIIGGAAVKGPTAKIMTELGVPVTNLAIAEHYGDLIDGLVIDRADAAEQAEIRALGIAVHVTDTLMRVDADKARLAADTLAFAARSRARPHTAAS